MMENSTGNSSAQGFILLGLFLGCAVLVFLFQRNHVPSYQGLYPAMQPLIEGRFEFQSDRVLVMLSAEPEWKRIVIFSYDEDGAQLGIIKPVHDLRVSIMKGEFPDFRVRMKNGQVDGFDIIKGANYAAQGKGDFLDYLLRARDSGRHFGVQECIYPICTRCLDVCPVISQGVILMPMAGDGRIYPIINLAKCPRCGKCFEVCKLGIILNPQHSASKPQVQPTQGF